MGEIKYDGIPSPELKSSLSFNIYSEWSLSKILDSRIPDLP